MKTKFGWNEFWKPTPIKMRKIGLMFLAVSTFISGFGMIDGMLWLSTVSLLIGIAGKVLTSFFSSEEIV